MGRLITLSGLDGSGKTTLCENLARNIINTGLTVNVIHFKNIDSFPYLLKAKKAAKNFIAVKNITDDRKKINILSAYIFCEKARELVPKSMSQYNLTIIDRYYESALCYHYLRGELYKELYEIYDCLAKSDLSVFLDVPPYTCLTRLQKRDKLLMHETEKNLEKAYSFYSSSFHSFWKVDGTSSINETTRLVSSKIIEKFF